MRILLPVILAMLACDQLASGYRFLGVFPLPGKSHFTMMEKLMIGLAKRGHQVDVVSHFPQKKPIPNYRDISLDGTAEKVVNNMNASDIKAFTSLSMHNLTYMVGDRTCALLETKQMQDLIKNPPKDPPYDAVIVELFVAHCYLALGRHLNVPMIGMAASQLLDWFNTEVGNPMNTAFVPSVFSTFSQEMTFWERVKNTMLANVVSMQLNYYTESQTEYVRKHFGMEVSSIKELYKDIALVLVNSHHTLHSIRPFTHAIVEVGGLHISEDIEPLPSDVKKWLDEAKDGCVFFTFGSMVRIETLPKDIVDAFYKSFERIAPVRVLMKVAKEEDLQPGLPKNVMIKPWFSQTAVLSHKNTKAFLTHGGLLGTTESIYFGVPMVGIPLFGDQHVNIMNYVKKKVAISLVSVENITVDGLTSALKTILYHNTYRENIKKLSALFKERPMSAMDTAIYWVEYVSKHGNILQSPAIHLNWFQRNLVDVYGFFAFCIVSALYALLLILRFAKNLLCSWKGCSKKRGKEAAAKKNK